MPGGADMIGFTGVINYEAINNTNTTAIATASGIVVADRPLPMKLQIILSRNDTLHLTDIEIVSFNSTDYVAIVGDTIALGENPVITPIRILPSIEQPSRLLQIILPDGTERPILLITASYIISEIGVPNE